MVELGANDGLRGLPVADMKRNLTEIITRAQSRGITVVLTGMEAPPNFGAAYTAEFRQVYRDLAKMRTTWRSCRSISTASRAFLSLNIADGMHPNPEGARIIERAMWRDARAAAREVAGRTPERGEMIELRGVSKTVQSGDHPLTILHPLDYAIPSGQFVAIVGPSGSGKSTLLGLLAGLDAPTHRRDPDRRRGHHAARPRTVWRSCAARRSGSSSSSSTSCRR